MVKVTLESSDKRNFVVDVTVAKMSTTIDAMLTNYGVTDMDMKENIIPIFKVRGEILQLVIKWCEKHKDNPPEAIDADQREMRTDCIDVWDKEFLEVAPSILLELIAAADYLDIKGLFDISCKTVKNKIKGKKAEEIRQIFNIPNDLTEEEVKFIDKENEWLQKK